MRHFGDADDNSYRRSRLQRSCLQMREVWKEKKTLGHVRWLLFHFIKNVKVREDISNTSQGHIHSFCYHFRSQS